MLIRAAWEDFGGGEGGEVGGSKERGKSASNKLTFLDNGSNKCHSIIFKLVKKPKILSPSLFSSFSFFFPLAIFGCQLYIEKTNSVC